MMQSKYFKLLNRTPVNKTHWAFLIIYSMIFGYFDPYYEVDIKKHVYIFLSGLFFLHIALNYYFLIYKEENKR